jgi:hypothetical protein
LAPKSEFTANVQEIVRRAIADATMTKAQFEQALNNGRNTLAPKGKVVATTQRARLDAAWIAIEEIRAASATANKRGLSLKVIEAVGRLGISEPQMSALFDGIPVAFQVSGAADGTLAIAQLIQTARLRAGIYTIRNEGGGLTDFITFESRARAAAKAVGALELELMGIEITNANLRAALELGGFTATTIPIPEELGGGTSTDVISRVELVD